MHSIYRNIFLKFAFALAIAFMSSCSESVTNVYDYYIKNNIETHKAGTISSSKTKLLYRNQESINKSQLELIAFKNDKMKCLVIGSHKIAKSFYINDSIYYFDVNDLYTNVRGNDFIRQLGDLSIFFTHVPMDKCDIFLANLDKLKSEYMKAAVMDGTSAFFDFAISSDVYFSIEKKFTTEYIENASTYVWVGKRKHKVNMDEFVNAIKELKSFN